jgi:predicted short-subunit dehydrogenase-like oxidoreductase (DUF2520 family)
MRISIIGAGNVAWHLAKALRLAGETIVTVYNRSEDNGIELAKAVNASYINELSQIGQDIDLVILSVRDDAIPEIVSQLKLSNTIVTHTSGSTGMEVLEGASNNIGVFYPFQTFTKAKEVNFKEIPFCIEGNSKETEQRLQNLAIKLSSNVQLVSSEQRKILHLAAIYTSNFANYLYTISESILTQHNLSFDLLKPLILETAQKVQAIAPKLAQTGPAKRNDLRIIEQHKKLLLFNPNYLEIYSLLTKGIQES